MIAADKKIPMPITSETLGNKEFDMKFWGALVLLYSNHIKDGEMIINKKDIDKKKLGYVIGKSVRTIDRKVKWLKENKIIEVVKDEEGVFYRIRNLNDMTKYEWVEEQRINELIHSGNKNVIKIYLLLHLKLRDGLRRTIILKEISTGIGWSCNSHANAGECSKEIDLLVNLGFIKRTIIGCDRHEYDGKEKVDYIRGYIYELI